MTDIQIDNPVKVINYDRPWQEVKSHILRIVASFPNENKIIEDNEAEGKIMLLKPPVTAEAKAIGKDQIMYITRKSDGATCEVRFEVTNENNKISSYTELERDKKTLENFTILIGKAIAGTLAKSIANVNRQVQPKVNTAQGIVQLLILIAALLAIFLGLKAFL